MTMPTELELRHAERDCLLQVLVAQYESKNPKDFNRLVMWARAKMEPEDVKLVMQEFEAWKNSL